MAGAGGEVAQPEQVALVEVGIELGLAFLVVNVLRPAHEMGDRARRPVAIEHLEAEPAGREVALDRGQRVRRRRRQQAARTLVAVDPGTDEVVVAEIAHVDDQPVHHGGGIDEARGQRHLRTGGRRRRHEQRERGGGGEMHGRIGHAMEPSVANWCHRYGLGISHK